MRARGRRRGDQRAVGDGRDWGLSVRYADGEPPTGVGGALAAARGFVGDEPVLVSRETRCCASACTRTSPPSRASASTRSRCGSQPARGRRRPRRATCSARAAVSILLDAARRRRPDRRRARPRRPRARPARRRLPALSRRPATRCSRATAACSSGSRRRSMPASLEDCTVQGAGRGPSDGARRAHAAARPGDHRARRARLPTPTSARTRRSAPAWSSRAREIEHSIVLPEAELRFVGTRLESSVIGRGARIVRGFDLPDAIRVSLGDGAEVSPPLISNPFSQPRDLKAACRVASPGCSRGRYRPPSPSPCSPSRRSSCSRRAPPAAHAAPCTRR